MNTDPRLTNGTQDRWRFWRVRVLALLSVFAVTPVGFGLKLYSGPGQHWANNYAAGVMYVVFWCLVLLFIWPRPASIMWIAVGVLLITSALELAQLWHPPILEQARQSFLGRALIGTSFDWMDFPHYFVGFLLGWMWMQAVVRTGRNALSGQDRLR
jgi:hypothetical protein